MATVYANRVFLVDNYGIIAIPDGDLISFTFDTDANITFAQGNTEDNSSSGVTDGNRETRGTFAAFIRKGAPWLSVLLRQSQVDDPNYKLSVSALVAQFGVGNQFNPQIRVTLNDVIFNTEGYDFSNVNSAAPQRFSFLAMSVVNQ